MSQIRIEVDQNDIRRINAKLKNMEKSSKYIRNAIKRTTTAAMKMLRDGRKQGYTMNAKRFGGDIRRFDATPTNLSAAIKASGRPPTIMKFKTSNPKSGGKVDITKSGLKKLVTESGGAAFIAQGGRVAGKMVQRVGKARTSLKILHGNSVPKIVDQIYKGNRGGQGNMDAKIKKRLHEEIQKEMERII